MRKRQRLQRAITIIVTALSVIALARPAAAATPVTGWTAKADAASADIGTLVHRDGRTARGVLLVVQEPAVAPILRIAICEALPPCIKYSKVLAPGDYAMENNVSRATLTTDVDGLGHIDVRFLTYSVRGAFLACWDDRVASVITATEGDQHSAFAGFGGWVGDWMIDGAGTCGINAVGSAIAWTIA